MHVPLQSAPYGVSLVSAFLRPPSQTGETAEFAGYKHEEGCAPAPRTYSGSASIPVAEGLFCANSRLGCLEHNELHTLLTSGNIEQALARFGQPVVSDPINP